jgi:hypothetical protein
MSNGLWFPNLDDTAIGFSNTGFTYLKDNANRERNTGFTYLKSNANRERDTGFTYLKSNANSERNTGFTYLKSNANGGFSDLWFPDPVIRHHSNKKKLETIYENEIFEDNA